MEEELKFPLEFNECPNCRGTRKVFNTVMEQEKAKGKIGEDAKGGTRTQMVIVADMRKTFLSAPALMITWDICADCGMEHCIRVDLTTATPQMQKQGPGLKGLGFPQSRPNLS